MNMENFDSKNSDIKYYVDDLMWVKKTLNFVLEISSTSTAC